MQDMEPFCGSTYVDLCMRKGMTAHESVANEMVMVRQGIFCVNIPEPSFLRRVFMLDLNILPLRGHSKAFHVRVYIFPYSRDLRRRCEHNYGKRRLHVTSLE